MSQPLQLEGRDLTDHVGLTLTKGMKIPLGGGESTDIYGGIWMDRGQPKSVAIKNYRLTLNAPEEIVEAVNRRLIRESNSWLDLCHPNVQQYYGHCSGLGLTVALISPYRPNGNIMQYMRNTPCSRGVCIKFIPEIANGLNYLHSKDIVHADLHCDNILIDDQGCALLTDFGRSKKIGVPGYCTALFAGSTRHMAPEFFPKESPGGGEVDQDTIFCMATDIYAFAMVCFQVSTGEIPFSNLRHDYHIIAALHKLHRPAAPTAVRDRIASPVWDTMCRCWVQDPKQRPSAEEVVKLLANVSAR
ncbi:kinase-like protein [Athelia psychrophila]|uniref:Kinase-like protein n=1 Tax=Athelia psychrophila TaxID=1759441 RepID=A0A166P871_9AGAM|nr:kinase-like protein [Fibularhizoctonia sp. CBS 109695]